MERNLALREVAALGAALDIVPDPSLKAAMIDALLSRLEIVAPGAARLCGSVLVAHGDDVGSEIGEKVLARVGRDVGVIDAPAIPATHADTAILAVKPPELDACLAVFGVPSTEPPRILGRSGLCGWFVQAEGRRVVITMAGSAGNVQAAMVIEALRREVAIASAILVGMAAGLEDKVDLGDVVIAEAVLEYEYARLTEDGAEYQPKPYAVPERHIRSAEIIDRLDPEWDAKCRGLVVAQGTSSENALSAEAVGEWTPAIHRGVVLAGAKLLEDGSLPRLRHELHDRVRAAEMEGAGFAAACIEANIPWLVVRGIADHGNPDRDKAWQFAATVAAASVARLVVCSGFLIPSDTGRPVASASTSG